MDLAMHMPPDRERRIDLGGNSIRAFRYFLKVVQAGSRPDTAALIVSFQVPVQWTPALSLMMESTKSRNAITFAGGNCRDGR
ncbi:MAG: hypothetical protein JWP25_8673 [Bradyrhizobium sp.]|nr:hypothetical protein [Bradyrhizobium sp.]